MLSWFFGSNQIHFQTALLVYAIVSNLVKQCLRSLLIDFDFGFNSGTEISIIITEPTHSETLNQIKQTKSLQSNLPNYIQPANSTKENLVKPNLQNKTAKLNQICLHKSTKIIEIS